MVKVVKCLLNGQTDVLKKKKHSVSFPYVISNCGLNGISKITSSYDVGPKNTPVKNSDKIAKRPGLPGFL
jgi:hypothetical protein